MYICCCINSAEFYILRLNFIRMDLQEVGCGHVDWIGLAQDRDGW